MSAPPTPHTMRSFGLTDASIPFLLFENLTMFTVFGNTMTKKQLMPPISFCCEDQHRHQTGGHSISLHSHSDT
jgi:hypothetical protein